MNTPRFINQAEAGVFTIRGEAASKANSRELENFGDRAAIIKSAKARSFEAVAMLQIPSAAKRMFSGPVAVEMNIYYASNLPDLDESIVLDVLQAKFTGVGKKRKLVRTGVYLNDRQVTEKHIFKHIDKANPRVEIAVAPVATQQEITE
jgi:Holliday junction resolvase RusA-like endonuclease